MEGIEHLKFPIPDPQKVEIVGPVGDKGATLENRDGGWQPVYRIRVGDRVTHWGTYDRTFTLDGVCYISPYWHGGGDWLALSPDQAIQYLALGESNDQ